jgi:serine/threonine protein kinase
MRALQAGDPEWVGKYRLLGLLGSGGMGRVFLGQSPGGRRVAVKLIRPELAEDPGFRARFAQEVAAARKVSGIYTAPLVDADPDGPNPWLVTAYVDGPSLADAVELRGPLPVTSVLPLAAGLVEGLGMIHSAGVVHRDLKPTNVLLASDGPHIIDFGIARATDGTSLTRTGWVVGSPGFMSPEEAEGGEIGPPSDVFAFGAVLTFAATGEGPFGEGTAAALLYRIVHSPPAIDGLHREIRSLVERCLAKDPKQRPSTDELLADLDKVRPVEGWLPWSDTSSETEVMPGNVSPGGLTGHLRSRRISAPRWTRRRTRTVSAVIEAERTLTSPVLARSTTGQESAPVSNPSQTSDPVTEVDRTNKALQLLDEAAQIADYLGSNPDKSYQRADLLTHVAVALARIDPARAESIARSLYVDKKAETLRGIAEVTIRSNPSEAARLLDDSQHYFKQYLEQYLAGNSPLKWQLEIEAFVFQLKLTAVIQELASADLDTVTSLLDDMQQIVQGFQTIFSEWALAVLAGKVVGISTDVAVRIADSISDRDLQAEVLGQIALALAGTDLDRASQIALGLVPESEGRFGSSRSSAAAFVLAGVAEASRGDPARAKELLVVAEQMARQAGWTRHRLLDAAMEALSKVSFSPVLHEQVAAEADMFARRSSNGYAMLRVAEVTAQSDPSHAAELFAEAADMAHRMSDESSRKAIAVAAAGIDLRVAEQIARGFTGKMRDEALVRVAAEGARSDLGRAERIARNLTDEDKRDEALAWVAAECARTDLARAERIARSITSAKWRIEVAAAAASVDPSRGEQMARGVTVTTLQVEALTRIAVAIADTDRAHALSLLAEAGQTARTVGKHLLERIAVAAVGIDPAWAERMVSGMTAEWRWRVLDQVATAMTSTDPVRAEEIARRIAEQARSSDGKRKLGDHLVSIAEKWLDLASEIGKRTEAM